MASSLMPVTLAPTCKSNGEECYALLGRGVCTQLRPRAQQRVLSMKTNIHLVARQSVNTRLNSKFSPRAAAEIQESRMSGDSPFRGLADLKVHDIMSTAVHTCRPEDSIFRAMEILVDNRVSGVPVVNDDNEVVGVISGYDLLALDATPGTLDDSDGFFPQLAVLQEVYRCRELYGGSREVMWNEFKVLREALQKRKGTTVGDVMRPAVSVSPNQDIMDASNLIVRKKLHRLAVVDEKGRLMGMLSRGDILRATIQNFRQYMRSADEEDGILFPEGL